MDTDVVIIGAGVIGIACAAVGASGGYRTLLLEQHASFGQETSSRNSEVVHSGIYYPSGSLKARLCVAGNGRTYAECERLGVWYRRCGKLIVATTTDEEPELETLFHRGCGNGVGDLVRISGREARLLEPHIQCISALYSPSTGIVDSHELMKAYLHEAQSHGTDVAFGVRVREGVPRPDGFTVSCTDADGSPVSFSSRFVINAAGLWADSVAETFGIDIDAAGYRIHPNRGHYYRVAPAKSRLVTRLVYPVPHASLSGLGIHITVDKAGQVRLGPDTEYVDRSPDRDAWYRFDDSRRDRFHRAVVRYFPELAPADLSPDQVGVRPKLQAPGEGPRDFVIREEHDKGLPGFVNLIGIESPGLTCAGEIAREVFRQLEAIG